jgi:hypothetical protein
MFGNYYQLLKVVKVVNLIHCQQIPSPNPEVLPFIDWLLSLGSYWSLCTMRQQLQDITEWCGQISAIWLIHILLAMLLFWKHQFQPCRGGGLGNSQENTKFGPSVVIMPLLLQFNTFGGSMTLVIICDAISYVYGFIFIYFSCNSARFINLCCAPSIRKK